MMEGASKCWAAPLEWVEEGAADVVVPPPLVELDEVKYCSGVEYVNRSKSKKVGFTPGIFSSLIVCLPGLRYDWKNNRPGIICSHTPLGWYGSPQPVTAVIVTAGLESSVTEY